MHNFLPAACYADDLKIYELWKTQQENQELYNFEGEGCILEAMSRSDNTFQVLRQMLKEQSRKLRLPLATLLGNFDRASGTGNSAIRQLYRHLSREQKEIFLDKNALQSKAGWLHWQC